MNVAVYCRVSTEKSDQANSFVSQQEYFRTYIQNHPEWELYEVYADEGITGTSTKKRAQFNRMVNDAYEGKFRLIITKEVSRFSRNILDTIAYTRELRAIGVGVIFVNDRINTLEPEAEMLLSFLASLAQEESRRTSSRVVWGQTRQMEKGVVFGRSLLGYDLNAGILTVNPEGAKIVREIFQKYAVEQIGTAEIARYLTNQGYLTYRGHNKWNAATVIKILKNEKYVGDLIQKKTYTPDFLSHEKKYNRGEVPFVTIENHHLPIIEREVWVLAQERIQKNNKHAVEEKGNSNRYVFSGKIRCAECGANFVGRIRYRNDGSKVRRWCCATAARDGAASCKIGKLVRDDDALQMLYTAIQSLPFQRKEIIARLAQWSAKAILEDRSHIGTEELHRLKMEMDGTQKKIVSVLDSYFSGDITKEEMQTLKKQYDKKMEQLRLRMQEGQNQQQSIDALHSRIQETLEGILNGKIQSEIFCKTMLESLTVFRDRHMELRLKNLPRVFYFQG